MPAGNTSKGIDLPRSTTAGPCISCGVLPLDHNAWCPECGALLPTDHVQRPEGHRPPVSAPIEAAALSTTGEPAEPVHPLEATCPVCQGVIDAGYCLRCGAAEGPLRDHFQQVPAVWLAGVSDRGVRHHRNEDALALAADPVPCSHGVIVVCDGVSSSDDSDTASMAAALAARDLLDGSRRSASSHRGPSSNALLQQAVEAANAAVISSTGAPTNTSHPDTSHPEDHSTSHPDDRSAQVPEASSAAACTFVAALIDQDDVTVANIGDSRAYWIGDDADVRLLTVDDSMAQVRMAMGVDRETAENGPQAHAITRWLGADAPDLTLTPHRFHVPGDGWLILCSDGLWNYASTPEHLLTLVQEAALSGIHEPRDLAAHLTRWACVQGGHDNITVAAARFGPRQDVSGIVPGATARSSMAPTPDTMSDAVTTTPDDATGHLRADDTDTVQMCAGPDLMDEAGHTGLDIPGGDEATRSTDGFDIAPGTHDESPARDSDD